MLYNYHNHAFMSNFVATLQARQMLHDCMAGTADLLQREQVRGYIGIDPTAPSMHIGNLATLMLLKQLQAAGHKPVVLLGGGTGMIGDPKPDAERQLLTKEKLQHNQEHLHAQLKGFLDFEGPAAAQLLNNYEWLSKLNLLDFLREAGKHITIGYLLGKDAIKSRMATGLSYTEFAYPLLQAYDFYHLYTHHGVKLQMGGSDQWGNITTGSEFIRKSCGGEAFALTTPLITKADGRKFGKSEAGNIWLDAKMTSPYTFYQFWLNIADAEALPLLYKMTMLPLSTIAQLETEHKEQPEQRILQRRLAQELTTAVHGQATCRQVAEASTLLFGHKPLAALKTLDEKLLLEVLAALPQVKVAATHLDPAPSLLDLLTAQTAGRIFSSRRQAREMIQAGAVRINKVKVTAPEEALDAKWLFGQYLLIQRGKKNYFLLQKV
jgi:tyrosyl-tRNA synthetase